MQRPTIPVRWQFGVSAPERLNCKIIFNSHRQVSHRTKLFAHTFTNGYNLQFNFWYTKKYISIYNIYYTRLVSAKRGYSRIIFQNLEWWWQMPLTIYLAASAAEYPEYPDRHFEHQGHQSKPSIQRTRLNEAKWIAPQIVPWKLHVGPQITLFIAWLFWSRDMPYSSIVNMPFCSISQATPQSLMNSGKRRAKKDPLIQPS